jgi:hypothetical protein
MLEDRVIELLESGSALIVGFVTAGGQPLAGRAWGMTMSGRGARGRVLVDPRDLEQLGHDRPDVVGTWIAVTGANVLTLSSAQVKGPVIALEPATAVDRETCERFCDHFFADVEVVDSIPRWMMERLVPAELVAVEFDVVEAYDQTPGPGAGAQLQEGDGARR